MKNINPYPSYKPSGIAWLGEIPTHWEVRRLKHLGKAIIGITYNPKDLTDSQNGILVLRSSNVQNEKIDYKDCSYVNQKIQESQLTKKNDILICSRNGSINLIGKNATIDEKATGLTFGAFMTIFRSENNRYISYFLKSIQFKSQIGLCFTSTINQLTNGILNNLFLAIPKDLEEQTAIAHFLDYKLHKIDLFIRKKKKLIALLNEQKAAIINDAVTTGIDPSVKMKPSGIEWLESIPNHWEMIRTKHIFRLITDVAPPNNSEILLSIYTQYGVKPRTEFEERGNRATTTDNYWIVKKQDIIVNKLLAWMGAIGISEYDGVTSPAYDILRSNGKADPYFYHYLFRIPIMFNEFKRHSRGIMDVRLRLYFSEFGDIKLPTPPLSEQKAIVTHIETETAILNRTIATIEKEIALVQEYRTTLIAEAVTGKIDVRDYEIKMIDEALEEDLEAEMGVDTDLSRENREGGEEE